MHLSWSVLHLVVIVCRTTENFNECKRIFRMVEYYKLHWQHGQCWCKIAIDTRSPRRIWFRFHLISVYNFASICIIDDVPCGRFDSCRYLHSLCRVSSKTLTNAFFLAIFFHFGFSIFDVFSLSRTVRFSTYTAKASEKNRHCDIS